MAVHNGPVQQVTSCSSQLVGDDMVAENGGRAVALAVLKVAPMTGFNKLACRGTVYGASSRLHDQDVDTLDPSFADTS